MGILPMFGGFFQPTGETPVPPPNRFAFPVNPKTHPATLFVCFPGRVVQMAGDGF